MAGGSRMSLVLTRPLAWSPRASPERGASSTPPMELVVFTFIFTLPPLRHLCVSSLITLLYPGGLARPPRVQSYVSSPARRVSRLDVIRAHLSPPGPRVHRVHPYRVVDPADPLALGPHGSAMGPLRSGPAWKWGFWRLASILRTRYRTRISSHNAGPRLGPRPLDPLPAV